MYYGAVHGGARGGPGFRRTGSGPFMIFLIGLGCSFGSYYFVAAEVAFGVTTLATTGVLNGLRYFERNEPPYGRSPCHDIDNSFSSPLL